MMLRFCCPPLLLRVLNGALPCFAFVAFRSRFRKPQYFGNGVKIGRRRRDVGVAQVCRVWHGPAIPHSEWEGDVPVEVTGT